jgi:hypothetical protein
MCQKAFDLASQPAEQKLVIEVLRIQPSADTMKLAIKLMKVSALKEEAREVVWVIAQKLEAKGGDATELLKSAGLDKVNLEIVKAEYGSGTTQRDVTGVLRKLVTGLLFIALPGKDFNSSFGGDPAPNTDKQLKIQYKVNGKAGEATFAENAVIVLPMPK